MARSQTGSGGELCARQNFFATNSSSVQAQGGPGKNGLISEKAGDAATTVGSLADAQLWQPCDVDRAIRKEPERPSSMVIKTAQPQPPGEVFLLVNDFPESGMPRPAGVLSVSPTGICRYSNFAL